MRSKAYIAIDLKSFYASVNEPCPKFSLSEKLQSAKG